MAITVNIYSNVNTSSKSISIDFVGDVLAANTEIIPLNNVASVEYYFKVTTGAVQDDDAVYPARVVRSLSELVLNPAEPTKQKQRVVNTNAAYSDIKSMIVDYVYDHINGHGADLYSSGVTAQRPMKF